MVRPMARKPASQAQGPLTEVHLKTLDKVIEYCQGTLEYCAKCDRCDIDVDAERKKTESQLATAKKIKAEFFPNTR